MLIGIALAIWGALCLTIPIFVAYCMVRSLESTVMEMDEELKRFANCGRCAGRGWVTRADGDRDECPACHGGGRRLMPGEEW